MKSMIKDTLILLLITVISGGVLGLVFQVTKEPIRIAQEKKTQEAYREAFPEAVSFEEDGEFSDSEAEKIIKDSYPNCIIETSMYAFDADMNVLGYVLKVLSTDGYSGNISFLVGLKLDGTINAVSLLEIKESAGLGMNAEAVLIPQYAGKPIAVFEVTKAGATKENEVDAISGATITTDAINNGVNAAVSYFNVMYASQIVTEGGETNEE